MKKEDARREVMGAWHTWAQSAGVKTPASGADALKFFGHLQREKPDLLRFKASGDPWQVVHGWLLNAQLVRN